MGVSTNHLHIPSLDEGERRRIILSTFLPWFVDEGRVSHARREKRVKASLKNNGVLLKMIQPASKNRDGKKNIPCTKPSLSGRLQGEATTFNRVEENFSLYCLLEAARMRNASSFKNKVPRDGTCCRSRCRHRGVKHTSKSLNRAGGAL